MRQSWNSTRAHCAMSCGSFSSWACVATQPQQEQRAVEQLQRQSFQTFFPAYRVKKKNRHFAVRPLFPNYIFVDIANAAKWSAINNTEYVKQVLTYTPKEGEYRQPHLFPAEFIESLKAQVVELEGEPRSAVVNYIPVGCKVEIISGPLKHMEALVEWTDGERVALLVSIFNRTTKARFHVSDVVVLK